ncbi:MAG: dTDP-glucose 4,6-dehydratase [Porphyromonas sp.]|nr:dTDP-glucose 4,6-dehydratase [Porphyromonas sp.]
MDKKTILLTGGAGFIGSNFLHYMVARYPEYHFVCLDLLTYAGNLQNIESLLQLPNLTFVHGSIEDATLLEQLFREYAITHVVNMAAESHVDRSIRDPLAFVRTNVLGTVTLLNTAHEAWKGASASSRLFLHVSTDEVYGSLLPFDPPFSEENRYEPHSPYSASKASSDHFVRAYADTYGLPVAISNCSNNYGPYQFPEKLIPLVINNIVEKKKIPVYGNGLQVRDWLFVLDHVRALDLILHNATPGSTYNIGGGNEKTNIELIKLLIALVDRRLNRAEGSSLSLITHVPDRLGHDIRYAIDSTKLRRELGWSASVSFEDAIAHTVEWYLEHTEWLCNITSGEYQNYIRRMYGDHIE